MTFEWPVDRSGLPELPSIGNDPDEPTEAYTKALLERNAAEDIAVGVMWALSGRQYGLNTQTVRPCIARSLNRYDDWYSYALTYSPDDTWISWPCGCYGGRCEVGGPRAVHLPGPVHSVSEVKIVGAVLDPSGYAIEGNVLYRRGGNWPAQDLERPLGEVNTWSVTYVRGIVVPRGVDKLTGMLVKEMLDALNNEGRCRLPRTVTTVSRQGVTYRAYDPAVIYANGKTGMPEIDLWLSTVNPHYLAAAPSVI